MNFLFLNNPRGGVEDLAYVKAKCPWVGGVYCNVRDYPASMWEPVVRARARNLGLVCGAWGRTRRADGTYDYAFLNQLASIGHAWNCPVIVNSEKELDGTGNKATTEIARVMQGLDASISTEPWLFDSVDWAPVGHMPVHLQIFPLEADAAKDWRACRKRAWDKGFDQVFCTYGTSPDIGYTPSTCALNEPYSLFTGDPPMSSYTLEKWAPVASTYVSVRPTKRRKRAD